MLNIDQIKDINVLEKSIKADVPWINKLLDQYDIDESDRTVLSRLIHNLKTIYFKDQEEVKDIDLLRDMSILELMFNYKKVWGFRKFVHVYPAQTPALLIPTIFDEDNMATVSTIKSDSCDSVFTDLRSKVMEELFSKIDTDTVEINDLEQYLNNQPNCDVVINSSTIMNQNSFTPMKSNAIVIEEFNLKHQIIKVENSVPMDEIIIKYNKIKNNIGFCFVPYLMPMRNNTVLYGNDIKHVSMARFAVWSSPNIKNYYKRVKVLIK